MRKYKNDLENDIIKLIKDLIGYVWRLLFLVSVVAIIFIIIAAVVIISIFA